MEKVSVMVATQTITICLLDDDVSVLKANTRLLCSAGWTVEPFSDPAEFLKYAAKEQPRVAIIDIRMPGMNGLEVQKRLAQISADTKVVVLTSHDDPAVRAEALRAGATAFFIKPASDDGLLDHLAATLPN